MTSQEFRALKLAASELSFEPVVFAKATGIYRIVAEDLLKRFSGDGIAALASLIETSCCDGDSSTTVSEKKSNGAVAESDLYLAVSDPDVSSQVNWDQLNGLVATAKSCVQQLANEDSSQHQQARQRRGSGKNEKFLWWLLGRTGWDFQLARRRRQATWDWTEKTSFISSFVPMIQERRGTTNCPTTTSLNQKEKDTPTTNILSSFHLTMFPELGGSDRKPSTPLERLLKKKLPPEDLRGIMMDDQHDGKLKGKGSFLVGISTRQARALCALLSNYSSDNQLGTATPSLESIAPRIDQGDTSDSKQENFVIPVFLGLHFYRSLMFFNRAFCGYEDQFTGFGATVRKMTRTVLAADDVDFPLTEADFKEDPRLFTALSAFQGRVPPRWLLVRCEDSMLQFSGVGGVAQNKFQTYLVAIGFFAIVFAQPDLLNCCIESELKMLEFLSSSIQEEIPAGKSFSFPSSTRTPARVVIDCSLSWVHNKGLRHPIWLHVLGRPRRSAFAPALTSRGDDEEGACVFGTNYEGFTEGYLQPASTTDLLLFCESTRCAEIMLRRFPQLANSDEEETKLCGQGFLADSAASSFF